jgi:hypothetical protein
MHRFSRKLRHADKQAATHKSLTLLLPPPYSIALQEFFDSCGGKGAHLSIYQFTTSYLPPVHNGKIRSSSKRWAKDISNRKAKKLAREIGRRNWREWYESTKFIRCLK